MSNLIRNVCCYVSAGKRAATCVTRVTLLVFAAGLAAAPLMAQAPMGIAGDIALTGDFDGDGQLDWAVWRPSDGTFMVQLTTGFSGTTFIELAFGIPGDIPVVGTYSNTVNTSTGLRMTDFAVFRPSTGTWYYVPSNGYITGVAPTAVPFGILGDIPVVGDFDGDGITDFVVWRPSNGTWYLKLSGNPTPLSFQWGQAGDVPVTGDFDGSGKSEMAVWRPSEGNWYVISGKDGTAFVKQWGLPGDIPYAADFDADGTTDYAVWRPSDENLYVSLSTGGQFNMQSRPPNELVDSTKFSVGGSGSLGNGVFVAVAGDFDGDGKPDFALFDAGLSQRSVRPGYWYIVKSGSATSPTTTQFGEAGDIPVPGFYQNSYPSGSATTQTALAVWRPSNGVWYILPTNGNAQYNVQWGLPGDIPVIGDFDGDGKVDYVVWRPSNGTWYCILTTRGPTSPVIGQFGLTGDMPVSGTFNGNAAGTVTTLTVWRPSNGYWYIALNGNPSTQYSVQFGLPGDLPVGGDFSGAGTTDFAVWRASDARYYFAAGTNTSPASDTSQIQLAVASNAFIYNQPPVTPFLFVP